ncbi:hypothetical protein PDESU_03341 [Pontiella desulfatans]|uniref:Uncharacterized protein n=1 Tax=Pontiella desulfatans TaxID=2750659 RepID=A0A6C2U417_PONDE|nr:hypothetical protein [Pontiella desulfatans]VGO14772.1 hypothetical protein PDESU_03341 [Pontiella desulfatans]
MPLETLELKTVLCPIFGSAKTCRQLFGLSDKQLIKLANEGIIRRKKTGESKNSAALYHVQDVYDWMVAK